MARRTLLSWSSGKDSAWALHVLRGDPAVDVVGLFSVMNESSARIPMHSTRKELLRRQAEAAGLPLRTVEFPEPCSEEESDRIMGEFVARAAADGIECIAFGDLFLEDIRQYREDRLNGTGIDAIFPLWGIPTGELADRILAGGVEAYVSSVDLKTMPAGVVGRRWSRELLAELSAGVDPCGENGEMHTVVVGGPMFRTSIPVRVGEVEERNGFAYADIVPV